MAPEKTFRHSANPGMCLSRTNDLFHLKLAIVVPVDHIARHVRISSVHVSKYAFLRNKPCSAFENCSAFHVIPVTVAINNVTNGLSREPLLELALKPFREICTQRIYEDDAVRSDQKQAVPGAIPGAIHIIGNLDDLACRPPLCRCKQRAE